VIGAVLGALGAGGAAHAYNVLQGQKDGQVRWSASFLSQRARSLLLLYLAIAHYGRGRGAWVEGEAPSHWAPLVNEVSTRCDAQIERIASGDVPAPAASLEEEIAAAAREALVRLYPEARSIFDLTTTRASTV
jgi:hypothetical protein